mmetsp:Transcript_540/g.3824  ORF Transcript_540/g.3824 Transcript_540/m.3824 type:complete len:103 (+) Transcript_540:1672-1980(+)
MNMALCSLSKEPFCVHNEVHGFVQDPALHSKRCMNETGSPREKMEMKRECPILMPFKHVSLCHTTGNTEAGAHAQLPTCQSFSLMRGGSNPSGNEILDHLVP